jgi:hypothetical protein
MLMKTFLLKTNCLIREKPWEKLHKQFANFPPINSSFPFNHFRYALISLFFIINLAVFLPVN